MEDIGTELDIFGQQPALNKLYTQITFCFSVHDPSSHPAIIETLEDGLKRLTTSFPWVAGQVVEEKSSAGNTGIFKIRPSEKAPLLIVKDLRYDPSIPSMETLELANFPISMLDESVVAPCKTLPDKSTLDSTARVFLLQANFVSGGLLLTFVSLHSVMDMTGQNQLMCLLSKACHNERFTRDEILTGNLPRHNIIALFDDSEQQGLDLTHQMAKPPPNSIQCDAPPPRCYWAYFTFPSKSLKALKTLATETISVPSGYISTDDALSALIWQSVSRARLVRLNPTTKTTFARAVDPRRYLGIPQAYLGIVQNMTYTSHTIQELLAEPLGQIASVLRAAVDPETSKLGHNTRALATLLSCSPDKGAVSVVASIDPSVDVMLSSWGKVDSGLDFSLGLGKAVVVRRPNFDPVESLMYLMPSTNGEIALAICLRDEDMERLKVDDDFAKYGSYVG